MTLTPGFKTQEPDFSQQKAALDQRAVTNVAGGNITILPVAGLTPQEVQTLSEAAGANDRQRFNAVLKTIRPDAIDMARDGLFDELRERTLAERRTLYMDAYVTAINNGNYAEAAYWLKTSLKCAREQVGLARDSNGTLLTADQLMQQTLTSIGNRLGTPAQKEELLVSAIEQGGSATAIFGAARDMGIGSNLSSGNPKITVMDNLFHLVDERAETLFRDLVRLHGMPESPTRDVDFNNRLTEFRNLLGDNALDQAILSAGFTERTAFMDNIYVRLRQQAGLP